MNNIYAEIITIGDEILFGHINDTNSQWLGNELNQMGIKPIRKTSIGDEKVTIISTVNQALDRADIVITTGGLGPTADDITKSAIAELLGVELEMNDVALEQVTDYFKKIGKEVSDINKGQALAPKGSIPLKNEQGTAPGLWIEHREKVIIVMPGVPYEMKSLMLNEVFPKLLDKFGGQEYYHKTVKTCGIGESSLMPKIEDWENNLPDNIKLAYLPSPGEVKLRLTSKGDNYEKLKKATQEQIDQLQRIIPEYIYGFDKDTLESKIGELLSDKKLTLSTAESCTGGYLAHRITSVPGSSSYYFGSIISYDNSVKESLLGVNKDILAKHGAVSEETVKQMAEGVRKKLRTDIGVSTSGIAGPDGGTDEKPVGTIWIALSDKNGTITKKLHIGKSRDINIHITAIMVMNMIRQRILAQ